MDFPNGIPSSCMEIFLSIIIIKSSVFRSVNSAKIRSLRHPLYCIPVPWKYVFRISCIKRNNPYKPMTVIILFRPMLYHTGGSSLCKKLGNKFLNKIWIGMGKFNNKVVFKVIPEAEWHCDFLIKLHI